MGTVLGTLSQPHSVTPKTRRGQPNSYRDELQTPIQFESTRSDIKRNASVIHEGAFQFQTMEPTVTESKKAVLGVVILFGPIAAFILSAPLPRQSMGLGYVPSIVILVVTMASVFGIWRLNHQRDAAPDFLAQLIGGYLDGGGFCFCLVPVVGEAGMTARIYFQNRYERPCRASVAFRQANLFSRAVPELVADVDCGGGEFGFVQVAWPVPVKAAGKKVKLEVFAAAEYPQGRGEELRHRSGVFVSTAPTLRGQSKYTGVGGSHAYMKLVLPTEIPESKSLTPPSTTILWMLGDPIPAPGFPVDPTPLA